jgi:hypothetical protein
LIDEAVSVITSLRVIFEEGARKYGAGGKNNAHRGCACM